MCWHCTIKGVNGAFLCLSGVQIGPGAIMLFSFFVHHMSLHRWQALCPSPDPTVHQWRTPLKLPGRRLGSFEKSWRNVDGETCVGHWNLLKGEEDKTSAELSPQERGTALCDQKCHGKAVHCSEPSEFFFFFSFCSSGPVIHLQGLRLSEPIEGSTKCPHKSVTPHILPKGN